MEAKKLCLGYRGAIGAACAPKPGKAPYNGGAPPHIVRKAGKKFRKSFES